MALDLGEKLKNASILARSAAFEKAGSDDSAFDGGMPVDGSEDACTGDTPFDVGKLFDECEGVCTGGVPLDEGKPFDVGTPFDVGDDTCGTCRMPYSMSRIRSVTDGAYS